MILHNLSIGLRSVAAEVTCFITRRYPAILLPNEILLEIFGVTLAGDDTKIAHRTLACVHLVCRQWHSAVDVILPPYVELADNQEADAHSDLLTDAGPRLTETLAIGITQHATGFKTPNRVEHALQMHTAIRKLVVFYGDQESPDLANQAPLRLPQLSTLVDVTILSPNPAGFDSITGLQLIQVLPPTVRFLHLPGNPTTALDALTDPSHLQLYGLTIRDYPTPLTDWLLSGSATSLQYLSVCKIDDIPSLVATHPDLRSLKIHGSTPDSCQGLADFLSLERLELHTHSLAQDINFPPSLRYLRFWSSDLAWDIPTLLTIGRLPSVALIVYDYFFPHWHPNGGPQRVMSGLQNACAANGTELRTYKRPSQTVATGVR